MSRAGRRALVERTDRALPVSQQCRLLAISRSSVYRRPAPPFTIHVGDEAKGEFAGGQFHWRVPGEVGFEIVRQMYAQGFDPAFTSVAKIDYALGIPLTHLATPTRFCRSM